MAELGFKHKSSFLKPHTFPPIGCSLPKIFLDYLLYFWHLSYIDLTLKITSMGSYCYTSVTNVKTGVKRVWTIVPRLYYCYGEGNGTPLQCSCLENPMDIGAWWAAVHGVAQSQTWLKRLSSSSSSSKGFSGSSAGKKSAYNVWHLGFISGLGRYPREGNSYPLQ